MKLIKEIYGVPNGEVYPRTFPAGEDCPSELVEAARQMGAIEQKVVKKAPETK